MREMWDAALAGEIERAREIDATLRPLYEALGVTINPIPVKAAMQMLGLIPSDTPAVADGVAPTRSAAAGRCASALEGLGLTVTAG